MRTVEKEATATVEEYFAYLNTIEGKAEYDNGIIVDMAGCDPEHSRIAANCGSAIDSQLGDRDCSVFSSDLHIGIELAYSYFFPDVTIICGPLERSSRHKSVVRNPHVIIEVLSTSTSDWDRTGKLIRYMQISTLREYLLIEQAKPQVEVCFINENGVWDYEKVVGMDGNVNIRSLGISVPMAKIYRRVEFPPEGR
jgi:Uma2 family endonuclease